MRLRANRKVQFSTTLDEDVVKEFKETCNALPSGVNMNTVLEELMRMFIKGEVDCNITISVNSIKKNKVNDKN